MIVVVVAVTCILLVICCCGAGATSQVGLIDTIPIVIQTSGEGMRREIFSLYDGVDPHVQTQLFCMKNEINSDHCARLHARAMETYDLYTTTKGIDTETTSNKVHIIPVTVQSYDGHNVLTEFSFTHSNTEENILSEAASLCDNLDITLESCASLVDHALNVQSEYQNFIYSLR